MQLIHQNISAIFRRCMAESWMTPSPATCLCDQKLRGPADPAADILQNRPTRDYFWIQFSQRSRVYPDLRNINSKDLHGNWQDGGAAQPAEPL